MKALIILGLVLAQPASPQVPVPVEIRIPEYPEVAIKARMGEVVEVEESIAPDGTVSAAVVHGKALPPLSAASLRAARDWKFNGDASRPTRKYVIRFEFTVDVDSEWQSDCYVGPTSVTISLPTQTVHIRGWLRPGLPTVVN